MGEKLYCKNYISLTLSFNYLIDLFIYLLCSCTIHLLINTHFCFFFHIHQLKNAVYNVNIQHMIHQSLEMNFNTPYIEVCKNYVF